MLYFSISVTNLMMFLIDFNPLSNFPHGGKVFAPSPMGEGWDGGLIIYEQNLNIDKLFNKNCYLYCEELHR